MANGASRLFNIMKNTSEDTNTRPSQVTSLIVKSVNPLILIRDDRLTITEDFCIFNKYIDRNAIEVGDILTAFVFSEGQVYYIEDNEDKLPINSISISSSEPTTNTKVWIKMGENVEKEIYVKNDNGVFEKLVTDTGWVDMTPYINTAYFRARPYYVPKVRRIGNMVYWQGEVYCHTAPDNNLIGILQDIPSIFRPQYQHSSSGVPYLGDTEPYNIFIDEDGIIKVSQENNITTQDEVCGYQISNLSGYLAD